MAIPDVDLDVADRDAAVAQFPKAIRASQVNHEKTTLVPHNTGIYLQNIPVDPVRGLATFPYDVAEDLGYYKLDLIPYHVYNDVSSEAHLIELVAVAESDDFPWEWFLEERFYSSDDSHGRVTHLGSHPDTVAMYPPTSVLDVAALIALIRPRKKYLIGKPWEEIVSKIWLDLPEEDTGKKGSYFFKKSHAVAFALVILVHLQLLDAAETKQAADDAADLFAPVDDW